MPECSRVSQENYDFRVVSRAFSWSFLLRKAISYCTENSGLFYGFPHFLAAGVKVGVTDVEKRKIFLFLSRSVLSILIPITAFLLFATKVAKISVQPHIRFIMLTNHTIIIKPYPKQHWKGNKTKTPSPSYMPKELLLGWKKMLVSPFSHSVYRGLLRCLDVTNQVSCYCEFQRIKKFPRLLHNVCSKLFRRYTTTITDWISKR